MPSLLLSREPEGADAEGHGTVTRGCQMANASVRLYAELNDFLPAAMQGREVAVPLPENASVRSVLDHLEIPVDHVDLVLVNGRTSDLSAPLKDGDRVSAYPVFESFDISPLVHLRDRPLRRPRFVLDTHLGKLASGLRMLGFDSLYRNDFRDEELIRLSVDEPRTLLSRDRLLLENPSVMRGYRVQATDPREQLLEVIRRFDLMGSFLPFERCIRCNALLRVVPKEQVSGRLQALTRTHFDEFWLCPGCDRIYWKGSHYQKMFAFIEGLRRDLSGPRS